MAEFEEYIHSFTWWRSPHTASFLAGTFDFILLVAHIRWGNKSSSRVIELTGLADLADMRGKKKYNIDKNIIVTGDFCLQ